LNLHGVNNVRQTEIHTAESQVPETSASEFELTIEKLKSHKSPGIDQIPAELTKTICCEIHKRITSVSIWNKEELPEERKESILVPIYKKGNKIYCSNYSGISLLPTTYKHLSNILLSRLPPYREEIIGDYQCGFQRKNSTTDHIYFILQKKKKNGNTMKLRISFYRFKSSLRFS
jgi:hypothetical protein